MKNKNKSILLVFIISSLVILLTSFPLCATTSNTLPVTVPSIVSPSLAEHKQTIYEYIDQLKTIQNRTFQLLQLALDNPIKNLPNFQKNIDLINNEAAILRQKVLQYQTTIPDTSIQFRDVLLILNALNYSKNAVFTLELLSQTTTNVERAILLENFFKSRIESIDAVNIVENLVSQY